MCSVGFVARVVHCVIHLYGIFSHVGDDEFHGVDHRTHTQCTQVEVVAYGTLEERHLIQGVELRIANLVDERQYALGAVATTAESADGRHARVVPSLHHSFLHQYEQVALAEQYVCEVEFVELYLSRTVVVEWMVVAPCLLCPVDKEVVERTVAYELEGADGVCHSLPVVTLSVCVVIHRVCVPFRSGAPVWHVEHSIHDRVAEVHVGACHVNLGTQHHASRLHIARVHLVEQAQVLFNRTVAIRTVHSRLCRRALLLRDLLRCLFVDVCLALLYEIHGEVPQLLEVVGCIEHLAPLESQPLDVALNGTHIFHVFLLWVGVVHTQVAHTAILLGQSEVDGYSLGMTYVQVAVGFGRETCLQPSAVLACLQLGLHYLFHKTD